MSVDTHPQSDELESLLIEACNGSRSEAREFLVTFLERQVFVPRRHQEAPLSDAPAYPSELVSVLGIQDGGRVVVPVFTAVSLIEEWCGNQLAFYQLTGLELFNRIPEEWWLVLNPGQEYSKEFSPWEGGELKGGVEAVDLVVEENFALEACSTLQLQPLEGGEFKGLQEVIIKHIKDRAEVAAAYMLKEQAEEGDGEGGAAADLMPRLLIGIESPGVSGEEQEKIRDYLLAVARKEQIGGEEVRVFVGESVKSGITMGVFRKTEPFYQRKEKKLSWWQRVFVRG